MKAIAVVILLLLASAALVLSSCTPAPAPKMRTSICMAQPGVQFCQFTYDGDPKEEKAEEVKPL